MKIDRRCSCWLSFGGKIDSKFVKGGVVSCNERYDENKVWDCMKGLAHFTRNVDGCDLYLITRTAK
jgi:hypothetical protein